MNSTSKRRHTHDQSPQKIFLRKVILETENLSLLNFEKVRENSYSNCATFNCSLTVQKDRWLCIAVSAVRFSVEIVLPVFHICSCIGFYLQQSFLRFPWSRVADLLSVDFALWGFRPTPRAFVDNLLHSCGFWGFFAASSAFEPLLLATFSSACLDLVLAGWPSHRRRYGHCWNPVWCAVSYGFRHDCYRQHRGAVVKDQRHCHKWVLSNGDLGCFQDHLRAGTCLEIRPKVENQRKALDEKGYRPQQTTQSSFLRHFVRAHGLVGHLTVVIWFCDSCSLVLGLMFQPIKELKVDMMTVAPPYWNKETGNTLLALSLHRYVCY